MAENRELAFYLETVTKAMNEIAGEIESIQAAAEKVAEVIARDEVVHVIGPGGHSNMAVEEVFCVFCQVPLNVAAQPAAIVEDGKKHWGVPGGVG